MNKKEFAKKYFLYFKWGIVALIAIILMFIYEKPFNQVYDIPPTPQEEAKDIIGALINCFTVPGVVLSGMGALSYLAHKGAYDGLGYVFSNFALHSLIPGTHKDKPKSLYEYKQRKDASGRKWAYQLLTVGLVLLAIMFVLLIVYSIL